MLMSHVMQWIYENFLYLLLLVATLYGCYWLSGHKETLRMKGWMAVVLAVVHTVIGVLCVKLFAFLESGDGGNMSLFGAVFFMPVFYFAGAKLAKRKVADVFDIFAVTMIFTLLCARLNCLFSGCCLGKPIPGTEHTWPTRQAELVYYAVLLIFLWRKVGKPGFSGKVYPIYMMSYGIFRFIVEWFRETTNPVAFFHISHIWALVSTVVGAGIYIWLRKHPINQTGKKSGRKNKEEKK